VSWIEGAVVGAVVLVAVYFVVRQFVRPFGGEKGTCRSCGEVCVCKQAKRTED
jgi:hypothetical protein